MTDWLVDMANRTVTVYRRNERTYELVDTASRDAVIALPPFDSVDLVVAELFLLLPRAEEEPEHDEP